jgi:hypothetical protein
MTTDREWRMCACERALPAHADAAPDPAGGTGCGMAWRICEASNEIEERHITDITDIGVQPGGHLRQDASAGLALPNHQDGSEEKSMVEVADGRTGAARSRPEVVTVCGSMRFFERMLDLAAAETAAGAIVLAPFVVLPPEQQEDAAELKAMLDDLHRRKIAMSDRVVVVTDETGYIGESTMDEIVYAMSRGIRVEVLAMWRPAAAPDAEGGDRR